MSFIIGLTGHTGSGKTTACKVFLEQGFLVVDCDKLAHTVIDTDCKKDLVDAFSEKILTKDGKIDRPKLAKIVFSDKEKLDILNTISHKEIIKKIENIINSNQNRIIVLDAPTLFESKADSLCNVTIALSAKDELLLDRIIKRDNITPKKAKMRLENQKSKEFFKSHCDYYLENNKTEQDLYDEILNLVSQLKIKAKSYIKED